MSGTWDEIVKMLDKYSMEAWRAGYKQAAEESIQHFDSKHLATEGDLNHNQSGKCPACWAMAELRGENK